MPLVDLFNYEESYGRSIQLPKCNREACREVFAPCYNRGTNTYYCIACAREINRFPAYDQEKNGPLCEIPDRDLLMNMEARCFAGLQYVGTIRLEETSFWAKAKKKVEGMKLPPWNKESV